MSGEQRSSSRIILAIDQSYTRTGLAIFSHVPLHWQTISFRSARLHVEKRCILRSTLLSLIKEWSPTLMVVERVRLHRAGALSIDAAIALATITAACCDVAHEHHIPCYMLDSRSWKAAATGNGNADKAAAVWTVKALYGIEAVHDAADALLMASVAQRQPELLKEALW